MKQVHDTNQKIVGTSSIRIDGAKKALGRSKYACDINFPGMLHAKILRSTISHGTIKNIDISDAENLEGVKAVICYNNVPHIPYTSCGTPVDTAPLDTYVFDKKVRYHGEPIAAVAATSKEIAEEAIKLIKVEFDPLPAVFDPKEAASEGAPNIHEYCPDNIIDVFPVDLGSLEEGYAEVDRFFESEYSIPIIQHCCLETNGCVVLPNENGKITVWPSTQVPYPLRRILAKSIGIPERDVTIVMPSVGGGFGNKQEIIVEPICALLALRTNRPVRLVLNRNEDITSSRTRHSVRAYLKTGVKNDGTIVTREAEIYVNSGAYCSHGKAIPYIAGTSWAHTYNSPHIKFRGNLVYTNSPVGGAYRGFGDPQMFLANENHFDYISKELNIDPVEFRLKNVIKSGDEDRVFNWDLKNASLDECIKKGAEEFGWEEKHRSRKNTKGNLRKGYGMAAFTYSSSSIPPGGPDTTSATIKLNDDGTVTLMTASVDLGQGSDTVFAQIIAEELNIRPEDVIFAEINTDITPYDVGTYGTRQVYIGGRAIQLAARDLKGKIDLVASQMLGGEKENLIYEDRNVWLKEKPDKKISMYQIGQESYFGEKPVQVVGNGIWNSQGIVPAYGAHFAEVEVDVETGVVRVVRMIGVHDVGCVINPTLAEGQVEGGIMMGLGNALFEEIKMDSETGKVLNDSLQTYRLPTAKDMPEIKTIFVENKTEKGPYGALGVGEPSFIPSAAAITNAICDAIGTRIYSIPYTPEKIISAIKTANSRKDV